MEDDVLDKTVFGDDDDFSTVAAFFALLEPPKSEAMILLPPPPPLSFISSDRLLETFVLIVDLSGTCCSSFMPNDDLPVPERGVNEYASHKLSEAASSTAEAA